MVDKFCDFVMKKIKEKIENIDEEKEMVIDFGVRIIFGELPKILILFLLGFLFQIGWYTVLLFFLLAPYRSFTGGFHLKTHIGCMITTSILYLMPILIAKYAPINSNNVLLMLAILLGVFSIIVIARYAPADTENIPILSKKERKIKRIKAVIALGILLTIILFSPNKIVSYMLIYSMFLQDLTILPISYKLTNSKHGYEVYTQETAL